MVRTDIQIIENDLVISDNDLIIAESDTQHIQDTINANAGCWKQTYTEGVGVLRYLKSKDVAGLSRSIKIQLQNDGYKANPIIKFTSNSQLNIDPNVSV